jgi:hypothetical protein
MSTVQQEIPEEAIDHDLVDDGDWDWSLLDGQHDFIQTEYPFTMLNGAFGTGKTTALCSRIIKLMLQIPNNHGYLGRLDGKSLRQTTMKVLEELLSPELIASKNDQKGELKLKKKYGGSSLVYGDFKDIADLKNHALGFFAIDQAEEIPEETWNYLVGRLRRKCPILDPETGKKQYLVYGTCTLSRPEYGGRHYAFTGDTHCRWCQKKLSPYNGRTSPDKDPFWKLRIYPHYGFGVCNPEGPSHWIYRTFPNMPGEHTVSTGDEAKRSKYMGFTNTTFEARDAGLIMREDVENMEVSYAGSPAMHKRYLLGMWVEAEGLVYNGWNPNLSVVNPAELRYGGAPLLHKDLPVYEYIDHGVTAPTAAGTVVVEQCGCGCGQPNIWIIDEHYASNSSLYYHTQQIKNMRLRHGRKVLATTLDSQCFKALSSGAKGSGREDEFFSIADDYADWGLVCIPSQKTWDVGFNAITEALRPDPKHIHPITGAPGAPHLFVYRTCRHFIDEIQRYKWKKIKPGQVNREEPIDGDDHHMDGLNGFIAGRPEAQRIMEERKQSWIEAEFERDFVSDQYESAMTL